LLLFIVFPVPTCILLFGAALLFIARQCRLAGHAVVYFVSGPPCRITRRCRPATVYCSAMPPSCCLFLASAALSSSIIFQGRPAVVHYSPMPPCRCLLFGDAALLLFITFRGCIVVTYCSSPPCRCLFYWESALFTTLRGRPVVVYYSPAPPRCCLLLADGGP